MKYKMKDLVKILCIYFVYTTCQLIAYSGPPWGQFYNKASIERPQQEASFTSYMQSYPYQQQERITEDQYSIAGRLRELFPRRNDDLLDAMAQSLTQKMSEKLYWLSELSSSEQAILKLNIDVKFVLSSEMYRNRSLRHYDSQYFLSNRMQEPQSNALNQNHATFIANLFRNSQTELQGVEDPRLLDEYVLNIDRFLQNNALRQSGQLQFALLQSGLPNIFEILMVKSLNPEYITMLQEKFDKITQINGFTVQGPAVAPFQRPAVEPSQDLQKDALGTANIIRQITEALEELDDSQDENEKANNMMNILNLVTNLINALEWEFKSEWDLGTITPADINKTQKVSGLDLVSGLTEKEEYQKALAHLLFLVLEDGPLFDKIKISRFGGGIDDKQVQISLAKLYQKILSFNAILKFLSETQIKWLQEKIKDLEARTDQIIGEAKDLNFHIRVIEREDHKDADQFIDALGFIVLNYKSLNANQLLKLAETAHQKLVEKKRFKNDPRFNDIGELLTDLWSVALSRQESPNLKSLEHRKKAEDLFGNISFFPAKQPSFNDIARMVNNKSNSDFKKGSPRWRQRWYQKGLLYLFKYMHLEKPFSQEEYADLLDLTDKAKKRLAWMSGSLDWKTNENYQLLYLVLNKARALEPKEPTFTSPEESVEYFEMIEDLENHEEQALEKVKKNDESLANTQPDQLQDAIINMIINNYFGQDPQMQKLAIITLEAVNMGNPFGMDR